MLDLRARQEKPRTKLPPPVGLLVNEIAGGLELSWGWRTPQTYFLLLFCLAWDAFLIFWYGLALLIPSAPAVMLVAPVAHVAAGAYLSYRTAANLLNRTRIFVSSNALSVKHGPIRAGAPVELRAEDVTRIFCVEQRGRRQRMSYVVNAVIRGNHVVRLVTVKELQHALYLEQVLERALRIAQPLTPGELRRSEGVA